jgi:hypothetical protein
MSTQVEVVITEGDNYIIEVGTQGPPGVDGAGRATVQDSEPLVAVNGELWFNDSTDVLKVYANGVWQTQTLDDEFF